MRLINNSISFKSHYDNGNEYSKPLDDKKVNLLKVSSIQDKEIANLACYTAAKDYHDKKARKIEKIASTAIPVGTSLYDIITTAGAITTKLATGAITGLNFAIFIATMKPYNKLVSKSLDESPTLNKFAEHHPLVFSLLDVATITGIGLIVFKAVETAAEKTNSYLKSKPDIASKIEQIKQSINNSKAGSTVAKWLDKASIVTGNQYVKAALAIAGIGLIVNNINDSQKFKNERNSIVKQLSKERYDAERELVNKMALESLADN